MQGFTSGLRRLASVVIVLATVSCAGVDHADEPDDGDVELGPDLVVLENGDIERGTIITDNGSQVVLARPAGTLAIMRHEIKAVRRGEGGRPAVVPASTANRLPSLLTTVGVVAKRPWASDLRQIPATVVDVGVMRNVPYVSHSVWRIELNVYGDPANPACVEIGAYDDAPETKEELIAVMAELLPNEDDRATLRALPIEKGRSRRAGLTFETTPATEEDAYGAWWISIYDEKALDLSRASDAEMASVSSTADVTDRPADRVAPVPAKSASSGWATTDYGYSKRPKRSTGGSVYVRGYMKNGTYVRPHTRRSRR